jgi:L-lactate dehydrogenase complex protein LldE
MAPRYSKIVDLLSRVADIEILEPRRPDECCGFGGMFAVEEAAVSECMGQDKIGNHLATGAEVVTGADSACLMHMQGIAQRKKLPLRFLHVAQILAAGL